jgi:hypothetical protein
MRFAEQVEQIVKNRIEKDSLTLPTLPAVAIKAIELTRAADFNLQAATSLIESDPVLAVQVLRLGKSAGTAHRAVQLDQPSHLSPGRRETPRRACGDLVPARSRIA